MSDSVNYAQAAVPVSEFFGDVYTLGVNELELLEGVCAKVGFDMNSQWKRRRFLSVSDRKGLFLMHEDERTEWEELGVEEWGWEDIRTTLYRIYARERYREVCREVLGELVGRKGEGERKKKEYTEEDRGEFLEYVEKMERAASS